MDLSFYNTSHRFATDAHTLPAIVTEQFTASRQDLTRAPSGFASQGIHQLKQPEPGSLGNLLEQIIFAILCPVLLCF
jgi:hypothetical protein